MKRARLVGERGARIVQLFDDDAIDLDAAGEDDFLGFAAAGDACLRQNLLEAVAFRFGLRGGVKLRHFDSGFLTAGLLIAVW